MKQNITVEQVNELSNEAKEKLREWWKPQEGDKVIPIPGLEWEYFYCCENLHVGCYLDECEQLCVDEENKDEFYPLLSIGQMIEFLDSNTHITVKHGDDNEALWLVIEDHVKIPSFAFWNEELCDALWNACKYILQ